MDGHGLRGQGCQLLRHLRNIRPGLALHSRFCLEPQVPGHQPKGGMVEGKALVATPGQVLRQLIEGAEELQLGEEEPSYQS
ncbi:hypothetical protein P7K49_018027 [Saguinus oedipus]|uniref:Uncharacterized protein n=1 Tax=Saguinus oedipus TaxID=9490 RepID=A0ABQ9V484_SAGOE|nr:hypothetical protein P7K49_018027 [Saguinus oedipus]